MNFKIFECPVTTVFNELETGIHIPEHFEAILLNYNDRHIGFRRAISFRKDGETIAKLYWDEQFKKMKLFMKKEFPVHIELDNLGELLEVLLKQ